MTISMYQASVPVFVRQLRAMAGVLAKGAAFAAEQGIDPASLIEARLAPDMLPLPKQVQIATDMAKGCAARLAGVEAPRYEDNETSFEMLQERIARTIAYLETIPAQAIDGSEERDIVLKLRDRELPFKGQAYLLGFVLPNVLFHASTAYGILRMKGVPLGKQDFLGSL
jgi:uncharacterized protein